MISFETPGIKEQITKQLQLHYEEDEIIKGKYWEDGKGCAIGCILHSDDHSLFPKLFGLPEWLARLIDRLFEGLPNDKAKEFPSIVWSAIPKGKNDLWFDRLKWQFCAMLMRENLERQKSADLPKALKIEVVDAIEGCLALFVSALETNVWDESAA